MNKKIKAADAKHRKKKRIAKAKMQALKSKAAALKPPVTNEQTQQ